MDKDFDDNKTKLLLRKIDNNETFNICKIILFAVNFNSKELREIKEAFKGYKNRKEVLNMANNFLRVSKIEGYNIEYSKDNVVFKAKDGKSKEVKGVVNSKINKKIKGLNDKKLYKELKGEDKSEGKFYLIKSICEEIVKKSVDVNKLNNKLKELNKKEFPEENKKRKKITKEEIISYSLSKFGKEMNAHIEIVRLMKKESITYNDLVPIRERIQEFKDKRKNYLENAKKGITESIDGNKITENKGNRYESLLNSDIFEATINSYNLEVFINKVNTRDKEVESIYNIYKEHQKSLYGTKNKHIESNRSNINMKNLDRLIREYLELKKLNSKYINDSELNFEKVKNILFRKIKNKEINWKLNKKSLTSLNGLINERIKSNMFRKLNYYSYEASNSLLRKRINIANGNDCLHIEGINKLVEVNLNKKPQYNDVFKTKEEKKKFIDNIKDKLNIVKNVCSIGEIEKNLKNLEKIETFDKIDKKTTKKIREKFNMCYKEIYDSVDKIKKDYDYIDYDDNFDLENMKELSNLEYENKRNKLNKKFIDKNEIPKLVYEEFQKVREFRNLLNHPDKSFSNLENQISDVEVDNILNQYFDNIKLDLEHSGLYKVYNDDIKELFLNSLVNTNQSRYNFTPSFNDVIKNNNFKDKSNNISKEYYNLLKKIYNNIFIVDKAYQENKYNNAVNKLNTDKVKEDFRESEKIENKLLALQDRYNRRLNNENEEGSEKYVLSCIYAHMFNNFLEDMKFKIVNESNDIETIEDIFKEFKNMNKDKFIKELKEMNVYFFYLLKNLSEKSRNSLEHQLKSYSKNCENIVGIEINKILPLFKYFKNYNNKIKFKEVNIDLFFEKKALEECDNNGSEFETRLYQEKGISEDKQLSLHISNMFNSIYIDRIVKFFENSDNKKFKISADNVKELYEIENNKLDLNSILNKEKVEEKNEQLKIFNKNRNIKSQVMLEDLSSINYILNDIYSILLKFATTAGIILSNLFSDEITNSENNDKSTKNEFFEIKKEKKIELLNKLNNSELLDKDLKIIVSKLKADSKNEDNHDISVIRKAFCHYNKEVFELSILDMINLIRYLCSFDRKQKNNVTRAIVNYLNRKGISVEFEFNQNHFINNVILNNRTEEKLKPYHSDYKLELMEELIRF
ncbi:MAG: hypothetical protein ACK5HR_01940 [Mycoplasmatales bacterium]